MSAAEPKAPATTARPARGARTAELLSNLGLLPLVALIAAGGADGALWISREAALSALVAYGAIALSFLGGIRWGMAMRALVDARHAWQLGLSLLPAIAGWIAVLLPARPALGLLAAAFAAQGCWDVWAVDRGEAPAWYGKLRMRLTFAATGLLAVALVVVAG